MRTLKLRWFTNPETLGPVGRFLLATFINRFRDDLAMPGIYPPSPESQTQHYFFQVATMLTSSAGWPESFEQALLQVEYMAEAAAPTEPRSEADGLADAGPLADARGSVDLGEAVRLWLKNHPTDDEREVERAIEADKLRIEEDKAREAASRANQLRAEESRVERQTHTPEPIPAHRFWHSDDEGSEDWRQDAKIERGRIIVGQYGCAQCHQCAFPAVDDPPAGP